MKWKNEIYLSLNLELQVRRWSSPSVFSPEKGFNRRCSPEKLPSPSARVVPSRERESSCLIERKEGRKGRDFDEECVSLVEDERNKLCIWGHFFFAMKKKMGVCLAAWKKGEKGNIWEGNLDFGPKMKITKQYPQLATKFLLILSIKFSLLFSQN